MYDIKARVLDEEAILIDRISWRGIVRASPLGSHGSIC